ncbi:two-component system, sensor histidine kinase [Burkholderiaceae bacterium]|nr:two-component system, sensor histidine kinase [Burkholderiaceae bacterium]
MNSPPLPADDAERVRLLHELQVLDTAADPGFDALARLASTHTGCPIGALSLVDEQRQWFKASVGLTLRETPRDDAFCAYTILSPDLLVVPDASDDPRFSGNPLVTGGPRVRFYAGAPVVVEGHRIGAMCCLDHRPREFGEAERQGLADLAAVAGSLLQERLTARRLAFESGAQGVWDWDTAKKGLYFSDAWKAILGHAGHEVGTHVREWFSRIHPDDLPQAKAKLIAHLRGETPLYLAEHRMRHKSGHDIWVLNSGKVVRRAKSGRAQRMVGTLIDVTSQRQAQSSQSDRRAAELANIAKSEFLSRMSHEMRTPLNAVIGFTQLLLSRPDTPDADEVRDYAEHVLRAGEHLLALTNDVLDLQHVEEGRVMLEIVDVPLDGIVAQVIAQLGAAAEQCGVRFDNHVPDGLAVRADEQRLRQVLLNIASNAIKFNRPAGVVRWSVDVDALPGRVRLSVEDTGSGLKPAQLERLFQPFERLGRETSPIEGTGLGLLIARSLTRAMGGTLQVASVAGVGTRVVVELPMAQQTALPFAQPAAASGNATEHPPASLPTAPQAVPALRMLYVEDNRINAILFEEAIRLRDDVELRLAEDGNEALHQVRDWTPDVLVLDAHLPGMDGFELLDALRRQPGLSATPAFMCSADAMPDDVRRAAAAGFTGYWSKPINIAKIMSDLDRISANRRPAG